MPSVPCGRLRSGSMSDRQRLALAVVLMVVVWFAPTLIWPRKPADRRIAGSADSAAVRDSAQRPAAPPQPTAQPPIRPSASDTGRVIWVTSPYYKLGFSTLGARLVSAELTKYQSFAPGDTGRP